MDGGEREGGNLDGNWEGKSSEEGATGGLLPSVRKEQPAGGNGDFGLIFWLHCMVWQTDWLLEAGTLAIFETSAASGALYIIVDGLIAGLTSSRLVPLQFVSFIEPGLLR